MNSQESTTILNTCTKKSNEYRRRECTHQTAFKFLTTLLAFHIVLIPFLKVLHPTILDLPMGKIVGPIYRDKLSK